METLVVEGLSFTYPACREKALDNVSFTLHNGDFMVVCGATGSGIAWKAGIAAEVIARPTLSIGRHLQDTKVYLLTDQLFAWTLTVILLSILLERMLNRLFKVAGKGGKA